MLKGILCLPDEIQADLIIDRLKKQGIYAVKKYLGLGGGSFGYSAFAVEIYVYKKNFKEALELVSAMNQPISQQEEEEELSFGQWRIKNTEFGWEEAPSHLKKFIIGEEQRRFKRCACMVCIICITALAFFYLFLSMFELSELESIKTQRAKAEYYGVNTNTLVIGRSNNIPEPNHIPDEKEVKNGYLLGYLFVTGLSLLIAVSLIKMYYADFDDFRTRKLRICYGRCIGKESVYSRIGSYFFVDLCLNDKTVLKDVPVREKVCRNVENGDWLILANIGGPVKGPEPADEIDGVYYDPN